MRYFDWEKRLDNYLKTQAETEFVWGVNDCCHFAAKAAEIITGVGYGDLYPCADYKSAAELLKKHGGVVCIADNHYSRIAVKFAQRGDIVAANVSRSDLSLGVCLGMYAVFKSQDSLLFAQMKDFVQAWRVE